MRLTIPQPQFLQTLQTVEHAVNDRSTLPILTNILLETNEQELVLTATDLDIGIQCRFPLAQPIERGAVALPARKLTTIVRELPEDLVVLEAKKNHLATVNCRTSSFRIPGLPAEDFPALPSASQEHHVRIGQGALKTLVTQTAHAMSTEETRFILNGAFWVVQRQELVMVATDGRRLAVAQSPVQQGGKQAFQAVIPSKTVRELGRLLQHAETEDVTIASLSEHQLAIQFGGVTLITRVVEGQFPQYEKVIPPPSKTTVSCRRDELASAIRRVSLMTSAMSQAVLVELSSGRMVVAKDSPELGSAREELDATYTGEPLTMAFNPEFWLEVLKAMDTDEVMIEVSGPEKPAVIRQPGFTYVVLPMKLGP